MTDNKLGLDFSYNHVKDEANHEFVEFTISTPITKFQFLLDKPEFGRLLGDLNKWYDEIKDVDINNPYPDFHAGVMGGGEA